MWEVVQLVMKVRYRGRKRSSECPVLCMVKIEVYNCSYFFRVLGFGFRVMRSSGESVMMMECYQEFHEQKAPRRCKGE